MRERYQLHDEFVLYAGNVKPHKNLERLIEAFDLVRKRGLDHLKLVLIGDEISKYAALRRAVHQHQLHKYVRFLGFLPEETLAVMYRLAGVFVFPSLYEGFGLPPLEAMASGTPVVTSNVSSLPEVAGDAAVLVDPYDPDAIADGIERVLDRRGAAPRSAGERARARAAVLVGSVGAARARDLRGGRPRHPQRWLERRESRPRPRLADRHARRREGARGAVRALSRRRAVHAASTCRGSVSPAIERLPIHTSFAAAPAAASGATTASTCRSSRRPSSSSTSTASTSSSASSHCVREVGRPPGPAPSPLLLPHADALRVGPVRRLLRARAGRAAGQRRSCAPVMARLARWDRDTAGRVDRYVAISQYVAGRIRRYYNREATVVYPPVDTDFFRPDACHVAGPFRRMRWWCRRSCPTSGIDLAIEACRLAGVPLRIVGDGPERAALERRARGDTATCEFLGRRQRRRGPRAVSPRRRSCCCRAKRTSASCRSRRRPAAARSSRSAAAARSRRSSPGETGVLVDEADRRGVRRRASAARSTARSIRPPSGATPSGSAASGSPARWQRIVRER